MKKLEKLETAIMDATSDFFDGEGVSNKEIDATLNFLFSHLSKVIVCCMDDETRLGPDMAAKKMGEVLESKIKHACKEVDRMRGAVDNLVKKLSDALGVPIENVRVGDDVLSSVQRKPGETLQ